MKSRRWCALAWIGVLGLALIFAACAGRVYAPKRGVMYYHSELPAADRAVESARAAGKDKECPEDFKAAEKMKNDAYDIYLACRTAEGIAMANEAAARANGLCPAKAAPPPPPAPVAEPAPPPLPPPAAPAASISANPPSVDEGKCTTLSWSSENATEGTIDQGIGSVSPSGTREVCPKSTTQYTLTATGPGGFRTATTTVTVNPPPPPPPPPAPKVIDRLVLHINFDTNKSVIRPTDVPELEKAVAFVKKYPDAKISVEGYTDDRGTDRYNLGLSERRAQAVKKYLEQKGDVGAERITAVGKGKANPVGDNKTEKGRFENRRVEVLVLGE